MNRMEKVNRRSLISTPYVLWVIGFTVLPLFVIFRYAFTDKEGSFTFENVFATFDMIHMKAMIYSLGIALGCTIICVLLSYPLVMALRCLNFKKQKFTLFIFILPMWMNFILRILAWQMILSNNGILNFVLTGLGLEPLRIAFVIR